MNRWARLLLLLSIVTLVIAAAGIAWQRARPRATGTAPPTYVALGASDAVGIGAFRPAQEGWVPQVASGLPGSPHLLNLGVSGATLADVLTEQLPVAVDASPRWVTIWPGPNDFRNNVPLSTFTPELDRLLDALRPTDGQPRTIAVLNLPDFRLLPVFRQGDPAILDGRVREWNSAIAAAVTRHTDYAVLVDLYATRDEFAAHGEYISADGFHPSTAGYRRLADAALAMLRDRDAAALR